MLNKQSMEMPKKTYDTESNDRKDPLDAECNCQRSNYLRDFVDTVRTETHVIRLIKVTGAREIEK